MIPEPLSRVVSLLSRLPGVGEKSAQRFALFFAFAGPGLAAELGRALCQLHELVEPCSRCNNLAERSSEGPTVCEICRDTRRDDALLCVVAKVQDLFAIERSGAMRGRYYVLGKLLSPLDGIGPDELPLQALSDRVRGGVREVIIATPPSVDGEATALFIARELSALGAQVSRIASGVPHGGDLEFADQVTLGRAIDGRRSVDVP
ncbi:MAG TPA: recombination mediator RecR [Polyangiaceae bacterium]|nr:recombination mediator RecR [Polyangiaceae bacterium]